MGSRIQDCLGFAYNAHWDETSTAEKLRGLIGIKVVPLESRLLRQKDQHVTYLDFAEDYYIPHCVFAYDSPKQQQSESILAS